MSSFNVKPVEMRNYCALGGFSEFFGLLLVASGLALPPLSPPPSPLLPANIIMLKKFLRETANGGKCRECLI